MEYIMKIVTIVISLIGGNEFLNYNGVNFPIVKSGSGLYKENENYVYKGTNPDNYILFNDEIWRIILIEDKKLKIMRNQSIGSFPFDENNSNDFNNSSLKKYLNSAYYNSIRNKNIIDGDIGLISMFEYLKANSNIKKCYTINLYFKNEESCYKTNYINYMTYNNAIWTSTSDEDKFVYYVGNTYFGDALPRYSDYSVLPTLYLKSDIKLSGTGKINNPYKIKES